MFITKKFLTILVASALCAWAAPLSAQADQIEPQVWQAIYRPSNNEAMAPQIVLPTPESEEPGGMSISAAPLVSGRVVSNPSRATIALALGGGGIRGAAHIGVLRAFEKQGIPIDYIAGSSMGAVVGGMYAAGVPLDSLEQLFRDRSVFKAYTPSPMTWKLATLPVRELLRSAKRSLGMKTGLIGLYETNKVANLVNMRLWRDQTCIEQTAIPFAAVTVNLLDGKTYTLDRGNLGQALQASSAIPFYVKPVPYDGNLLIDGGVRANVPSLQARRSGADLVISVNVNERLRPTSVNTLRTFKDFSNRIVSMMLDEMDEHQVEYSDIEIRPSIVDVSLYSQNPKEALMMIQAGEEAANRAMPKIKALMYTKLASREN